MAILANRRSVMTLYSDAVDPASHAVRFVLAEKAINVEIHTVTSDNRPEDLNDLNPYNTILTLVDRELVLYEAQIIMEYLDERFPHPPLMPVDPVMRAQFRLALFRIESDWYSIAEEAESSSDGKLSSKSRKLLRESILQSSELFAARPFFLSDEFSLVDASIAPILWRLPLYGIELGSQAEAIERYMNRIFARRSFRQSMTELEQEMRA